MFQLILHHVYRKGPYAIDISGARNDGLVTAVGYMDTGASADSGALLFKSPYARVRVPPSATLTSLFALQIEVVVRVDALGGRRNLVEGADSFAFFVDEWGRLWGTFNGPQYKGGPPTWHGASSSADSPDGLTRTVPVGKWITLRYEHDGYASLRLYMDGKLVAANYSLVSGVPAVTGAGVNIGNWTIADNYQLDGAVDDVKLWRYDPDDGFGHFLCRKFDKNSAPCWASLFEWFAALLQDQRTRDRVIRLMNCISDVQREVLRRIRAAGENAIAENEKLADEYRVLWCEGSIDGERMKEWQQRFLKFLYETIGRQVLEELIAQARLCYLRSGLDALHPPRFDPVKCDPAFYGYLQNLIHSLGGSKHLGGL